VSASDDIVRFFHAVDDRAWDTVRAGLTGTVDTDYTSLFGGDPERLAADALVDRWRGLLPGFDGTQHLLGPIVVTPGDGGRATADCNVRGYHRLDGATWMVAGRYTLTLHRTDGTWQVAGIVLRTTYQDGDPALAERAASRASGGQE
jgi:hypothetical protein